MSRAARSGKAQPPLVVSHFQEALVLNQFLVGLFGIDPLHPHTDGGRKVRPLELLAKTRCSTALWRQPSRMLPKPTRLESI